MPKFEATQVNGVYMPIVECQVILAGGIAPHPTSFFAIVDSGADCTTLPSTMMPLWGIDFSSLPEIDPIFGLSGPTKARRCDATLRFHGRDFASSFCVVEAADPTTPPPPLLGRVDFFTKFRVQFEWYNTPPTFGVIFR